MRGVSVPAKFLLAASLTFLPVLCFGDPVGSVFVSGHDPDFHSTQGPNTLGAEHLIQDALTFARNGNTAPFLFLESNTDNNALGDHVDSEAGLIASGFSAGITPGSHYVKVNATQFATANLSLYSAIFIPSDHGGSLTGDDLEALDGRAADILSYLNGGGGLVAWAEDGFHTPTTDKSTPAVFGFLPFLVTSTALTEAENANTLSPFGTSLGLLSTDINGNFSHNLFTATGGMTPIDFDSGKQILSLGFRGQFSVTGVGGVPEPGSIALLATALGSLLFAGRLQRKA